jgi:hypothetical protein
MYRKQLYLGTKIMAAAIDTTATTLEGQLWEVANRVQIAELNEPVETRPTNVTTTVDTENQTVSVTFTAPATFTISATGALIASPTPYLP